MPSSFDLELREHMNKFVFLKLDHKQFIWIGLVNFDHIRRCILLYVHIIPGVGALHIIPRSGVGACLYRVCTLFPDPRLGFAALPWFGVLTKYLSIF
jgi:hypothetical protein